LDGAFKTDLDNLAAAVSALAPSADPSQTVTSPSPSPSETGGEQLHALRAHLAAVMDQNASFTSLMVHEIRKPMTSIRGYSDMLAKPGLIGPLNDMQTQFVGIIRNNIINMEGLVSNISDLNKLMSGRMQLENKMTTFGQVVMDVQKQFDALAQELGNTLTYEVPQGLPILIADAKQLAKVIGHLVRNAVHYTPKGGQIILRAAKTEDEKLRVSIIDTGIGMKPEELARLGEPFFRADDPLVTGFKGYGLGVPVSARFLELMNSKLTFQSEFGKGTTASFVLESMTQA
jgi:signal transduction histidine kinase